jgi:hypothetical protein
MSTEGGGGPPPESSITAPGPNLSSSNFLFFRFFSFFSAGFSVFWTSVEFQSGPWRGDAAKKITRLEVTGRVTDSQKTP